MGNAPNRGKTERVRAWSEAEAREKAERQWDGFVESAREEQPGVWAVRIVRSYGTRRR